MLRVSLTFVVLALLSVLMMGNSVKEADIVAATPAAAPKPACPGFTIIEASKGIDCHGDTVRLVKRGGFYELATNLREAHASL